MATRSRIGVVCANGQVKSVYCHNDGYPEGVGADLLNIGFETAEEVEEFIDEGDRSTVDLSYKEWRNEDCPPRIDESEDAFWSSDIEEYGYLFSEGEWYVKDSGMPYFMTVEESINDVDPDEDESW